MSARLLYSLSEDNTNAQKQRGCINGFVQMFESHHFIIRRSADSRNHKRIQSGQSNKDESKFKHDHKAKELTDQKMEEKGRSSSELSRAFTSPSGSSSRDRSQKTEMESSSIRANAFQGPTSQDSRACQRNPLRTYSQANMQLAPMESIHGHGSSSKAATKEQGVRPIKHIDSPRPQYRFMPDKPKASTLYESPRSIDSGQNMGPASSAKRIGATRDSPRLSFDERESRGLSKPSPKFELPRLSLDSRRQAITRTNSERNTNIVPTEQQTERDNSRRDANLKQEPQSHRPIYNVVAKLMGLEAPPDYTPVCGGQILPNKFNIDKNINTFSRSSRSISERELSQLPYSPRNCLAYSLSPWPRDANPRTSSGSAPLNQWEEHNGFDKPVHKHHEDNKDPQSLSVSIYGEIEKRLSELDFQNSGTDLRALKRILEATTRSKLIAKQETQAPDKATPPDSSDSSHMSSNQGPRCVTYQDLHRDCQIPITSKRYNSTADIVPPPMATKQDKLRNSAKPVTNIEGEAFGQLPNLRRLRIRQPKGIPDQGTKQTPTKVLANNPHVQDPLTQSLDVVDTCSSVRKVAPSRSPKLPKHIITDKSTSLNKSKGTKRNLKLDNLQHQAPASPSYSIKITHHNVKPMESDTFPRRIKRKEQNGGDISTKASQGSTWPSQQGKVASPRKINMDKQIEPAVKNEAKLQTQTSQQVDKRENSVDGATLKIKTAVQEQPSPVSILDAAFYEDESPSPVKRKSLSFKDDETPTTLEYKQQTENMNQLSEKPRSCSSSEHENLKLETTEHIHKKPGQHKHIQDESQDSILSLPDDLKAEERYLLEILLASGFIGEFDINLPGKLVTRTEQAINPKLFCILEQTTSFIPSNVENISIKGNATSRPEDKLQRRLIFDVANEILVQKISLTGSSSKLSPRYNKKHGGSSVSSLQLLRELSEEIGSLQANSSDNRFDDDDEGFLASMTEKDLMNESVEWTLFSDENSGLVLDIERLIFKDLISELLDN